MTKRVHLFFCCIIALLAFPITIKAEFFPGKVKCIEERGIVEKAIYATGVEGLRKYWIVDLGKGWHKTSYIDETATKDFVIIDSDKSEKLIATTKDGTDGLLMHSEDTIIDVTPAFIKESNDAKILHIDSYTNTYPNDINAKKIFLSCSGNEAGLYYSHDLCRSWTKIIDGHIDFLTTNVRTDETSLVIGYTDEEHTTHILTSNDDGVSWKEVYAKPEARAMGAVFHPGIHVGLMCVFFGDDLFALTIDKGVTWKEAFLPEGTVDMSFHFNNDYELYAAANDENGMNLWHSNDLGENWECVYTLTKETSESIIDMDVYALNFYWLSSSGRVYNFMQEKDKFRLIYDYEELFSDIIPSQLNNVSTPYYDLQGRPVVNPARGIYIKDGKKIAVD